MDSDTTGVTYALCGARNPKQAIENAQAGLLNLATSDVEFVTNAVDVHLNAINSGE